MIDAHNFSTKSPSFGKQEKGAEIELSQKTLIIQTTKKRQTTILISLRTFFK